MSDELNYQELLAVQQVTPTTPIDSLSSPMQLRTTDFSLNQSKPTLRTLTESDQSAGAIITNGYIVSHGSED